MAECFCPARWNLKTVSLLQITLQILQVLTAFAAAPPSNTFLLFISKSSGVSAFFFFGTEMPFFGFSGGPMIGLLGTAKWTWGVKEVVATEATEFNFSRFFKCFFPNLC